MWKFSWTASSRAPINRKDPPSRLVSPRSKVGQVLVSAPPVENVQAAGRRVEEHGVAYAALQVR